MTPWPWQAGHCTMSSVGSAVRGRLMCFDLLVAQRCSICGAAVQNGLLVAEHAVSCATQGVEHGVACNPLRDPTGPIAADLDRAIGLAVEVWVVANKSDRVSLRP